MSPPDTNAISCRSGENDGSENDGLAATGGDRRGALVGSASDSSATTMAEPRGVHASVTKVSGEEG